MPPLITTAGAASAKGFGWTVSAAGVGGWIARTQNDYGSSGFKIYGDSTNGVFFVGKQVTYTGYVGLMSFAGALQRQYNFAYTYCCGQSGATYNIAALPSGASYIGAYTSQAQNFILKLTSSGAFDRSWKTSTANLYFDDIKVKSSGAAIIAGFTGNNCYIFQTDVSLSSFDASALLSGTSSNQVRGIALDSSENIVLAISSTSANAAYVFKIANSSPFLRTFSWRQQITSVGSVQLASVAIDSSGNIYLLGVATNSPAITFICKLNSSGAFQWARQLNNTSSSNDPNNRFLAFDSSGNVYAMWFSTASSAPNLIVKYNSSGVIQWQRQIRTSSGTYSLSPRGIYVNGNFMYLAFQLGSTNYPFMWKMPIDGSGMGTYAITAPAYTFVYEAASFTDSAITLTSTAVTTGTLGSATSTPSSYTTNWSSTSQDAWTTTVI